MPFSKYSHSTNANYAEQSNWNSFSFACVFGMKGWYKL